MTRVPRLTSKEMCRLLEREGFAEVSTRGSHRKYRNAAGVTVVVPLGKNPLRLGTQTAILAQAGISL
ncbi:MAG TPA: type II toxin-antitoxin system HicA family toxin [Streptosporangiaceae bacterium]|nr:type II toxin-antitoxin system HicA family toxin [Streptosporangiaceae bacterium]